MALRALQRTITPEEFPVDWDPRCSRPVPQECSDRKHRGSQAELEMINAIAESTGKLLCLPARTTRRLLVLPIYGVGPTPITPALPAFATRRLRRAPALLRDDPCGLRLLVVGEHASMLISDGFPQVRFDGGRMESSLGIEAVATRRRSRLPRALRSRPFVTLVASGVLLGGGLRFLPSGAAAPAGSAGGPTACLAR